MTIRSLVLAAVTAAAITAPALAQVTTPAPSVAPMPSTLLSGTEMFFADVTTPTNWRASEAMGLAVYNRSGERIGEVDDMILDGSGRVAAAVVGVGGFLGMGERKVAVAFRAFDMTREANGSPRLVVDLSKTALQSAPEYKAKAAAKRS